MEAGLVRSSRYGLAVQQPATLIATPQLHAAVEGLIARLGSCSVVRQSGWASFVDQFRFSSQAEASPATSASVVVGPLAHVLRHAQTADHEFGFVMPIAQLARPWSRQSSWRDDATLALWKAGWSPGAVDRVQVPGDGVVIEFAVGNARPTPTVETAAEAQEPNG